MSSLVTIQFHDDTLYAVEDGDSVFVAVKPISDRLGLDWRGQKQRIQRTPVLAKGGCVMHLPSPGGPQETMCLRFDLINGWLFGIDAERVSPEARPRVLAYQEECFAVLHRHFFGRRTDAIEISGSGKLTEEMSPATAVALVKEARLTFGNRQAAGLWHRLGLPAVEGMADPAQGALALTIPAPNVG